MRLTKKAQQLLFLLLVGTLAAMSASTAYALGIVSRSCAIAGAQESISVDWGFVPYSLWTASSHYVNGTLLHNTNTNSNAGAIGGWETTWRSYTGHFGSEYWYGKVTGYHYRRQGGLVIFMGNSTATDCNLRQWGGS